jgi:hypothetical protein
MSFRLRTWGELDMAQLPSLLTVEDSCWIEWFRTEAAGAFDPVKVIHYAVFTPEDCIEIVSEFPPLVEWVVRRPR